MYDVAALGELLIDFTPDGRNAKGVSLYARNPGGAPANVLAMVARLGASSAFLGKVGSDAFGTFLKNVLLENSIDTRGLRVDSQVNTTLAFVSLSESGERSFTFYRHPGADMMLTPAEVDVDVIAHSRIFHFGSLSLTDQPCKDATLYALSQVRGGIVSYDPNYRPLLWDSEQRAVEEMRSVLPQVHLLKVSEEELALLTGQTDLERGAHSLLDAGPSIVFVSQGARGASFFTQRFCGFCPAYSVRAVDTTGAGDAFWGAALFRLREKSAGALSSLDRAELLDIVDFANAAGALTATRLGAIPALPSREEIDALRAKGCER